MGSSNEVSHIFVYHALILSFCDSCLTLCGPWDAFHCHVWEHVISNDTVRFAIRHNMTGASLLVYWMEVIWWLSSLLSLCYVLWIFSSCLGYVMYASVSLLNIGEIFCHSQLNLSPWKYPLIIQFPFWSVPRGTDLELLEYCTCVLCCALLICHFFHSN